jgi:hypothetical protein
MALGPLSINAGGITVETVQQAQRKQRRPSHTFQLSFIPYDLQLFMLAPVLPGDTMKNLLLQARAVSDPVVSPLVGWWNEYYFFYVKLRDLNNRNTMTTMLLSNTPPAATAAVPRNYYNGSGFDYGQKCMERITETYFRDAEEILNAAQGVAPAVGSSGNYKAKVTMDNALQSMMLDADVPATQAEQLQGEGYTLPANLVQFQTHYDQWVEMRDLKLTAASFEDWLKQYGVKVDRLESDVEDVHIPELLRYVRDWTYPANTVDAAGAINSVLSWSIAERADKDRYFNEPGFVVGVTTARPKVYLKKQAGNISSHLNDAFAWLPAVLEEQPFTSLKKFTALNGTGPIDDLLDAYWLDLKDLYLRGDQFLNTAPATALNSITLPDDQATPAGQPLNKSYALDADITALFKLAANNKIRVDGRVDISILSRIRETTP